MRTRRRVVDGRPGPTLRNVERLDRPRFPAAASGSAGGAGGAEILTRLLPPLRGVKFRGLKFRGLKRRPQVRLEPAWRFPWSANGPGSGSAVAAVAAWLRSIPRGPESWRGCRSLVRVDGLFVRDVARQPSKSASASAGGDSGGTDAVSPQPAKRGTSNRKMRVTKCLFVRESETDGNHEGLEGHKGKILGGRMGARGEERRVSRSVPCLSIPDFFVPSVTFVVEFVCCGPRPSRIALRPVDGRVGIVEGLQVGHADEFDVAAPAPALRLLAEEVPRLRVDEEEPAGSPLVTPRVLPDQPPAVVRRVAAGGLGRDVADDRQSVAPLRDFARLDARPAA